MKSKNSIACKNDNSFDKSEAGTISPNPIDVATMMLKYKWSIGVVMIPYICTELSCRPA